MKFTILLVLLVFNAFATPWSELEEGRTYELSQTFQLPQLGRTNSLQDFMKGEKVFLKEIFPLSLPGAGVTLYIFDYKNCPGPEMTTDMEIIPVIGTSPLVEVGAQLVKNCELYMFMEMKDFYSGSLVQ